MAVVASTSAYDSERIARLLTTIIKSEIAANLTLVETRWAAVAPITLPVPVSYTMGFNETLLERYSAEFPIISVIPAERDPEGPSLWGAQSHQAIIDIHFFVAADAQDDVNLLTYRYAEAMTLLLQDHQFVGDHRQNDYKPAVELSPSARHPVAAFADMQTEGGTDYVQGGRVTITLKAG